MNRSPIFRSLVLFLCFVFIGVPLYSVTKDKEPRAQEEKVTSSEGRELVEHLITIRSAHPFTSLKLAQTDLSFSTEDDTEAFYAENLDPKQAASIKVEWPLDTPETAVLIEIEREGFSFTKTYWAERRLSIEIPLNE